MKSSVRIYDFDYTLGDSYRCPQCGRKHLCRVHRYVYGRWYETYRAKMIDFTADHPELFPRDQWEAPR